MQTHTATVVQTGRGGGVCGWNPPRVSVTLRYFEKLLPLIHSVLYPLQDDINIIG